MRALLLTLALAATAHAQPARIVGAVTDAETGHPLVGAAVWLVDTSLGAAAGLDGRFSVEGVPAGEHTVRVAFVGYEAVDVPVRVRAGETVTLDVPLEIGPPLCDCVVVIEPPPLTTRGVYEARVARYEGWTSEGCCTVRRTRLHTPEPSRASR